jgi:glycosyltransferase involved in cell wall biosynthesis
MSTNKPIRIGILEIYSHHVFVHTLATIARAAGMEVTIYTCPRLYVDMVPLFGDQLDDYKWEVSPKGENNAQFLRRIKPQVERDLDLLVMNSVQGIRIGLFYLFKTKVKTIVGAGRISEFFGIKYKLSGFATLRKLLHHNYTRLLLQRCLPRYKGIIVHTDEARQFAAKHNYDKPMIQLPFSLYKGGVQATEVAQDKVVKFVVTGSIKASCRDHLGLLDCFETIWDSGRKDLSLTILSKAKGPDGLKVLARLKALEAKGYDVTYYADWIPEQAFLDEANEADFFISPLNLSYYSSGELTSGIVEVIRQGKPGIYPSGYLPDPVIESSSLFYDDFNDLAKTLISLLDDKSQITEYAQNAVKNSEKYGLEVVSKQFEQSIHQVLA